MHWFYCLNVFILPVNQRRTEKEKNKLSKNIYKFWFYLETNFVILFLILGLYRFFCRDLKIVCCDFNHVFVSEILKYFQYAFAHFSRAKTKKTHKVSPIITATCVRKNYIHEDNVCNAYTIQFSLKM